MKKTITYLGLAAALVFQTACETKNNDRAIAKDFVLDVKSIANKSPEEVVQVLGKADTSYLVTMVNFQFLVTEYRAYDLAIQYHPPLKVASDIIFKEVRGPLDMAQLRRFGIKPVAATDIMENIYIKWKNIPEFNTVSFSLDNKLASDSIENYEAYFNVKQK